MQSYLNRSGQSNVSRYEIGDNYILVEFKTRAKDGCNTYKYTYFSTGQENIEHMKRLAIAGIGLNSFISTNVKKRYESKR